MSTVTINSGDSVTKDPADIVVFQFDWNTYNLATGAEISSSNWAVAAITPTDAVVPTLDNASILTGNRKTQVRVTGGTVGAVYTLTNTIVTNESPAQTKERSIRLLLEQL